MEETDLGVMLRSALSIDDIDQLRLSRSDGISVIWVDISERPDLAALATRSTQEAGDAVCTWFFGNPGICIASATGNSSDEQQRETMQGWNATTGHLFISYPVPSSAGEASGTFTLAWSPNGARIASGGADPVVHLWSAPLCLPSDNGKRTRFHSCEALLAGGRPAT